VAELVWEEEALHGALQTRGRPRCHSLRPTLVHMESAYRGSKRRRRMAEHDPWTAMPGLGATDGSA
jgi:hypothetical protein